MRGSYLRTPGRGGGRRGAGCSGRSVTGPLPAPHLAEESGPQFPQFLYQVQPRISDSKFREVVTRVSVSAMRASCRLMQRSCGSARHQRSAVQTSWPAHLWHRSSKVEFNLAAIPPHLRRGKPRRKCSGRPGCSRPGCWRSVCQSALPEGTLAARHTLRRWHRQCKAFGHKRYPSWERSHGPSRPGPWRPSAHRTVPVFVGVWEPEVSQPLHRQSPPEAPAPDRLQGQHSASLRVLGGWETQRGLPASTPASTPPPSPARPCPLRDSQPPRLTLNPTPKRQCEFDRPAPPEGQRKGIKIYNRSSGSRRCRFASSECCGRCSTRSTLLRKFNVTD